jgi:hypothetical protein
MDDLCGEICRDFEQTGDVRGKYSVSEDLDFKHSESDTESLLGSESLLPAYPPGRMMSLMQWIKSKP